MDLGSETILCSDMVGIYDALQLYDNVAIFDSFLSLFIELL